MMRDFTLCCVHNPPRTNLIGSERQGLWVSLFVIAADAYMPQAHIYLNVIFWMYLRTSTCACESSLLPSSFWVLCCARYEKIVFQFRLHYFSCLWFFFSKVFFHKKRKQNIYKKKIFLFLFCCKFLLIKGTDNRTNTQTTEKSTQTIGDVKNKWHFCLRYTASKSDYSCSFFRFTQSSLSVINKQTSTKKNIEIKCREKETA